MAVYNTQDGLEFMKFMTQSHKTVIVVDIRPDEGWADVKDRIEKWASENLTEGTYRVHLGNESLLTDESAQYVVYSLEEEAPRVRQRWLGESF